MGDNFIRTGGEHSSFPGNYNMQSNFPYPSMPSVTSPATDGKTPFGAIPPAIKTGTTHAQVEPYISSFFPIAVDGQDRVMSYCPGEFMFAIHPKDRQSGIHVGKSLWDLNYSMKRAHVNWQDALKLQNDPKYLGGVYNAGKKRSSSANFLEGLEQKNIQTLARFEEIINYIGVSTDPTQSHIKQADKLSAASGVRTLVINNKGRVLVPNIWGGDLEMGTSVGLLVKKFTDPTPFLKDNLSWQTIVENLASLEVWPVVGIEAPGGLHGGMYKSAVVDTRIPEVKDRGHDWRLPAAGRGLRWEERDPHKVDCSYFDYEITRTVHPDGSFSYDGQLVVKSALYIHIGKIYKSVPKTPTLQEIKAAVQPFGQERGHIASEYIRLVSEHPVEVFVTQPGMGYFL